jgi:molybdate transport system regulatory protein
MNKLPGIISKIQKSGAIMLVDVDVDGHRFSALLIESAINQPWLCEGSAVDLVFKETEVSLAKDLKGKISTRNRMMCRVLELERGGLLSKITLRFLNYTIISAVTTRAVDSLQITVGEEVEALVKSNEVALMQK